MGEYLHSMRRTSQILHAVCAGKLKFILISQENFFLNKNDYLKEEFFGFLCCQSAEYKLPTKLRQIHRTCLRDAFLLGKSSVSKSSNVQRFIWFCQGYLAVDSTSTKVRIRTLFTRKIQSKLLSLVRFVHIFSNILAFCLQPSPF